MYKDKKSNKDNMVTYNCITDTTLLSVLRYGAATLVAGAGETLTADVGKLVEGVPLKYTKVDTGALVEMSAEEKTTVDAAEDDTITAARTISKKSISTYTVTQPSAYNITLPVAAAGLKYEFLLVGQGAFSVTIKATSTHLYGNFDDAGTRTQINAKTNILFAATNARIGDVISILGIDSTHWCVLGYNSNSGGITIS